MAGLRWDGLPGWATSRAFGAEAGTADVAKLFARIESDWPRGAPLAAREPPAADLDLVDYAIAETLKRGGDVVAVEDGPPLAAIFRY